MQWAYDCNLCVFVYIFDLGISVFIFMELPCLLNEFFFCHYFLLCNLVSSSSASSSVEP